MKKTLRFFICIIAASLMAITPGIDLAVEKNLEPDGLELFGYLYQLIGRTTASIDENRLTTAVLMAACLWLANKFLFHKPKGTGLGEYVLCGFLATMMLLATAVRTCDTVSVLWSNLFQLAKTFACLAGIYLFFLMLLRALNQMIQWLNSTVASAELRKADTFGSFWTYSILMALAWLPHMAARYPGVLMWDSYMQIKQFMGEAERWSNHPPFGTLLYGVVALLGEQLNNRNICYFLFTLVQCASMIGVLSYSLCVLKRQNADVRLRLGILLVYLISPAFVGWATVISKDTDYQIALLLLLVEMLVFVNERDRFLKGKLHFVLFGLSAVFMMLHRHNGAPVVAVVVAGMVMIQLKDKQYLGLAKLLVCVLLGFGIAFGIEGAITRALHIGDRYIPDVLSLPLQQTARVVKLHDEQIPENEKEIIDQVVDYDGLAKNYLDWYADPVKDSYRQTAGANERAAYWKVWFQQLLRWPVEYLDAMLHMNGVLFDLNDNRPMYIGFTDMELHSTVYPYSFNDMTMYDREQLVPLDNAQRAFTEWYMDFDRLPLVGMMASMSFHTLLLCMMLYLAWVGRNRGTILVALPALLTFGICLFSPVVYLRYTLPMMGTLPIALACLQIKNTEKRSKENVA